MKTDFLPYIFFDFDGTLCASEADIRAAWEKTISSLHLTCPDFRRIFRVGPSAEEMVDELFPDLPQEMKKNAVRNFKFSYDNSPFEHTIPYPWVNDLLRHCMEAGCNLYILTNKRIKPTAKLIRKCGWDGLFVKTFHPDSIEGKVLKKADMLHYALELLSCPADSAMIVGDTVGDIAAGKKNGIRTIGVTWGYGSADELKKAKADDIWTEEEVSQWLR